MIVVITLLCKGMAGFCPCDATLSPDLVATVPIRDFAAVELALSFGGAILVARAELTSFALVWAVAMHGMLVEPVTAAPLAVGIATPVAAFAFAPVAAFAAIVVLGVGIAAIAATSAMTAASTASMVATGIGKSCARRQRESRGTGEVF